MAVKTRNITDTPESAEDSGVEEPTPKKPKSQKEPYKPFLLIADLGRSSCKSLVMQEGEEIGMDRLASCVAKLDSSPGNDFGGFTLHLEHSTEHKDEKGRAIKEKTVEHWVVGERALAYSDSIRMTDRADAKVEYFHVLLMGVIASIPNLSSLSTGKSAKQRTLTIDLATLSIARADDLKKSLKHCKFVEIAGVKYRLNFTPQRFAFVEGHGAAVHGKALFTSRSSLHVADLGAGTFQIAEFAVQSELPTKKSKDAYHGGGGITSLKRECTRALSNDDASSYLSQTQVATILENSKWEDEHVVAEDFRKDDVSNAIAYAIDQWLRESPASFALESLASISRQSPVIFCGGGFEIPPVRAVVHRRLLASGADAANLVFPDGLGLIAVRGVLDYLRSRGISARSNVVKFHSVEKVEEFKEENSNADISETATA